MLEEIIEIGENSLVFTQYAGMGRMLEEFIQSSLGCETFFLHGGIPRKERDSMIKRFQEGVGLVTIKNHPEYLYFLSELVV